jgi:hypothetical protein
MTYIIFTFSGRLTLCKAGQSGITSANDGRRVFESRLTLSKFS